MTEDKTQAIKFLKEQADAGDTEAMHTLAFIYYEGAGTEKDLEQSFSWLKKAAEAGMTEAMFDLAYTYHEGEGTGKDLKQFFYWVKKAAEAGIPEAMHKLALAYYKGEGIEKELKQYFSWLKKAAKAGVPEAMNNLALAYYKGEDTEKDMKQYFFWVEKAAEAGVPEAMDNLALTYKNRDGSERNEEEYWIAKAYKFGAPYTLIYFSCALFLKEKLVDKTLHDTLVSKLLNLQKKCKEILRDREILGDRHDVDETRYLSHYTNIAALNSILEGKGSNHLRLYNITYFNDPLEGMSLPNVFDNDMCEYIYGSKDQSPHEIRVEGKSVSIYACAFTEVADRLDMWRAYGNNGDGYSITSKIPSSVRADEKLGLMEKLLPSQDVQSKPSEPDVSKDNGKIRIYKVLYGDAAKETYEETLKDSLEDLQCLLMKIRNEKVTQKIKNLVIQILAELRYLYKDEPYRSEQEYRIIDVVDAGNEKLEYDYASEPPRLYMKTVPFLFKNEGCKITIGPRVKDKDGAEVYIKHQLHKNNWSKTTEIVRSKIHYR